MATVFRISMALGVGLAALLLAPISDAQTVKRVPASPTQTVLGSSTFKIYCAVCHGIGGKGDGPAAKALTVAPADLTRIEKRHEGHFPEEAVRRTITGEDEIAAHGTRDMPMWGPVLRDMEDPATTQLRLNNLITYLESIQERF